MLPTKRSEKVKDMNKLTWLIYGRPKVGKSTFVSQFDDCLVIDTQHGYKNLEAFVISVNNWQEFLDVMKDLHGASFDSDGKLLKNRKFKCVAIDTVDDLYKMCFDFVCERESKKNRTSAWYPSDEEWGKGWSMINDEFQSVINFLQSLNAIYVSHVKLTPIKSDVMELTKIGPSFDSGKSGQLIQALADIIGYVHVVKGNQVIDVRGDDLLVTGEKTGRLPDRLPFDYQTIKKYLEESNETVPT